MVWALIAFAAVCVVLVAIGAVSRVTAELDQTVAPALLEVDDAVDAVADALPFEVSAQLSFGDVDLIVRWVLEWFDDLGLASEFGEELGGEWVVDDPVVVNEVAAAEHAVAQALAKRPKLDAVHVTVVVDELFTYLRDIGAIGGEVH